MNKAEIFFDVVNVGEIYETPNGRRFMVVGNDDRYPVVGMACIFDPLVKPNLGSFKTDMFLKTGVGFGIVDKQEFFAIYKRVSP